jgi:cellulose synthase/poly-beta-1,6-N-acetylglucosamine synthase-like glycosyltransferase
LDNAVDQYDNDNFSDGPQISIAVYAETRLPAPPLPPEFSAAGDRLGLKLLALFLGILCLAIFVLDDFRSLGAVTLFISLATHMPYIIALLAKRACFIAQPHAPLADDMLPVYSVLIPVYDEANMMAQIARSLAALDYPHYRLDVLILIEADDRQTCQAAKRIAWPPFLRLLTVHADGPKTKTRACNFGLAHARGALVVVYDAEDQPHPRQLRDAAARFHTAPPDIACLQAPLIIDQTSNDWLAAMFALEYRLLFTRFLPVLANFGCVIPLGGTSNHFRADTLRALGAWDSHNLTEDADLGIRLAYFGYRTEMINPPTFENAPHGLKIFLRQRIRWQSGHIQTIAVHLRQPRRAVNSMGVFNYVFFMLVLMCRLTNPVAHIVLIACFAAASATTGTMTLSLMLISVIVYLLYFVFAYRALGEDRKHMRLIYLITLPAYWLLIAPATLIALYRMARGQMGWMKTPHRPFRRKS